MSLDSIRSAMVVSAVMLLAPAWVGAQAVATPHDAHRLHGDSAAYIAALEDPARDGWQKPHEVVTALDLKPGETIADIGAGSGYFALRFAHHVGPGGRVFAVDVSQDMLTYLERRAAGADLRNIRRILALPDDPLLEDGTVDRVFVCNVWHHIDDKAGYLAKLRKALRPSGEIVMVDFHTGDLPVGPPAGMKIAREALIAQLEAQGFRLAREHSFLPYQYFLVFTAM